MEKPGRPLGLSIAIIVSTLLYTLFPIGQVLFYLSLFQHFENTEFLESGGAIGTSVTHISPLTVVLPLIYGLVFLVIAVMAWRGKPQAIRWIFMLAVFSITVITILMSIQSLNAPPSLDQGIDSGRASADPSSTDVPYSAFWSHCMLPGMLIAVQPEPSIAATTCRTLIHLPETRYAGVARSRSAISIRTSSKRSVLRTSDLGSSSIKA